MKSSEFAVGSPKHSDYITALNKVRRGLNIIIEQCKSHSRVTQYLLGVLRGRSLITGGWLQKGGGGQVKFYPNRNGWAGAEKVSAMLEGGTQSFEVV